MLKAPFEIESLSRRAAEVARLVPAGQLFAWLARSVTIPAGWAALAMREDRDPMLLAAGQRCESDHLLDVLFVRTTPIECTVEESDLQSADGHSCRGSVRVSVRILPDASDLSAFRRTILCSGQFMALVGIQRYLHWPLRQVLLSLAGGHTAADLLNSLDPAAAQRAVEEKLGPVCLAGGLKLDGPAVVQFDSPAYRDRCRSDADLEHQRRRAMARAQLQQALTAARTEQLSHLVKTLEQLRQVSVAHAEASFPELIRTLSAADRGEIYSALWQLCPPQRKTRYAAVVSGRELLLFESFDLGRPARRIELPESLGSLRSVSVDAQSLAVGVMMVGAGSGVHLVEIETGEVRQSLSAEVNHQRPLQGGVNAAAMSDDRIFATHSELGLLAWPKNDSAAGPAEPLCADITREANTIRCVRIAGGAVWFAADQTLWSLPLSEKCSAPIAYRGASSNISAVAVVDGTAYAGTVAGQIIAWECGEPASARTVRAAGGHPIESIHVMDVGGVERLIVADRSGGLTALVAGDNYSSRYASGELLIRRAAAAEDVFIAMNDNRDRLVAWDPRRPASPIGTIIIPHLTGSNIQDMCLVPSA